MFRTNLAKQGLVFPPGHAYWVGTPTAVIRDALQMAPVNSWIEVENKAIRIHSRVNTTEKGFNDVMEVARDYAAKGNNVDVMPTISTENDPLFAQLFKGAYPGKCPDLRVDGKFIEVKRVSKNNDNTIRHAIAHASNQSDHVVILLPEKVDYQILKRIAKSKFMQHGSLKKIEFKIQDAYYEFNRKNVINK
jgi:hypothetical protein